MEVGTVLEKAVITSRYQVSDIDMKKIPPLTGVYQFLEKNGKVLYVGKAKNIRNRINQYIELKDSRSLVIHLMKKAFFIEIILTGSEPEALILESHLIKKKQPFFNINLKDDKSYPYLALTDEFFPRLVVTRNPRKKYLYIKGPFTKVALLHSLKELLQSLYPLKYCSKNSPAGCINGQMGICSAPCKGNTDSYRDNVEAVIELLKGHRWQNLAGAINEKIEKAIKDLNFEKAAVLRDALSILPEIKRDYGIEFSGKGVEDSFLFKKEGEHLFVTVARFRDGNLFFLRSFCEKALFDSMESCIASGIASFYEGLPVPRKISVEPDMLSLEQLNLVIGSSIEKKVKHKLAVARILNRNMEQSVENHLRNEEKISLFKKDLKLFAGVDVESIQCVDISTFGGTESVAGFVWWENGSFVKSKYRKYRIKSVEGVDDFKSLREVAARIEKRWFDGSAQKPSLLLIDGGRGQISSVKSILKDEIKILGIVKDRGRKKGVEMLLDENGKTMELTDTLTANTLKSIRDEAHRFAIEYNRLLRKNKLTTTLKEIEGVGDRREKSLLLYFSTIERIKNASLNELKSVDGISESVAEKIYKYFRK